MAETLVTIGKYLEMTEAQIAAGMLRSEGIPVYPLDINHVSANPSLWFSLLSGLPRDQGRSFRLLGSIMRRKVLQDVANTLCQMAVGWRMNNDLEALAELPDGELRFDILAGTVTHSIVGEIPLHVASELSAWFTHRLSILRIPKNAIEKAQLRAAFRTDRIKTDRQRIVSFDWTCASSIDTDECSYIGATSYKHTWHSRCSSN